MAVEAISAVLAAGRRFLLVSHEDPEGDCLGASLALHRALCLSGRDSRIYNVHGVPYLYAFLPGADEVETTLPEGPFDAVIVLDCSGLERVGRGWEALAALAPVLINIDHHLSNAEFGALNLVSPSASSTGELVYQVLTAAALPMDPQVYQCLLCAVMTDTGSFRYANTTPAAFELAAQAVRAGVVPWDVARGMYERNRLARIRALALALGSIEVDPAGRWCVMTISADLLATTGATAHETEGFINYARSVDGVEVAVLIREDAPDLQKISFRSKGRVNVAPIAARFGGGGHHNAAACKMPVSLGEARRQLVPAVEAALALLEAP